MAVSVSAVVGRSTGAPDLACSAISPAAGHGGSGSSNPLPFTVNISSLNGSYTPGQNYISKYSCSISYTYGTYHIHMYTHIV